MIEFEMLGEKIQFRYPNLGLLYYKFAPKNTSGNFSSQFVARFTQPDLKPNEQIIKKRMQVYSDAGYACVEMRTVSRFICGIGYSSSIEWGFGFDWTSGMPCLPGSSVKGALLSYLEFLQESSFEEKGNSPNQSNSSDVELLTNGEKWSKEQVFTLFGSQGNDSIKESGAASFLDAYPIYYKGLEVEVITPHYKNYYGKKSGSKLPDDTENPVPIHFLTVKPGSVFAFYFCLRPQIISQKTEKDYWKKRIKELIVETGQNYGFGAKTASGYGYFEPVEEKS